MKGNIWGLFGELSVGFFSTTIKTAEADRMREMN